MIPELTLKLPEIQRQIIKGLIPFYGRNEEEVIESIVFHWIEQNIGSDSLKALEKIGAIKGFNDIEKLRK